jgi:hypothetical protein
MSFIIALIVLASNAKANAAIVSIKAYFFLPL